MSKLSDYPTDMTPEDASFCLSIYGGGLYARWPGTGICKLLYSHEQQDKAVALIKHFGFEPVDKCAELLRSKGWKMIDGTDCNWSKGNYSIDYKSCGKLWLQNEDDTEWVTLGRSSLIALTKLLEVLECGQE